MPAPLPLAAGLNGIEGLLSLLFILFWIVAQVRHLFGGADRGKPAGPVGPRPQGDDDERHRELMRQIDEIIGRASGERATSLAGPRRDRADRPRGPAVPRRTAGGPLSLPGGRRPKQSTRSDARTERPGTVPMIAAVEQPRTLGSLGGHATDVARHVDDAFAHEIAHLPAGAAVSAAAATPATPANAAGIAALLRDPTTLQQLVLVREVLDRPVDRW